MDITTPLITPERLYADPQAAFSAPPAWVRQFHLEYPEGHEDDPAKFEPVAIIVLGKTREVARTYSILQAALLMELTRFPGISIVTNRNGTGPHARWYVRLAFAGYPEDLTTLSRLFSGAAEYDQTKVAGSIKSDMRTENLRNDPAKKIGKDARQVVLGHAERIATEFEKSGRMPSHLTAAAYMANLRRLLQLNDEEATGKDLSDMLPDEEA